MQTQRPLRWGVLGTGWMLGKYTEAFTLVRDATLVAVASRDPQRAREAAKQFKIAHAHDSYQALIENSEVDVVLNALHNGLHCEWSIRALEAGKHVLCEKPLACSLDEAQRMFAAAHANKRLLMEAFMYRFHPHIVEAKRRVAAGEIGRVIHIRSARTVHGRPRDNPRYWRAAGGGALLDIGCYCVNISRMFAAAEPQHVEAQAHFDDATNVDLTLTGTLEFPSKTTAQFVCSFEAEPTYSVEIIGAAGKLLIAHPWLPPTSPNEIEITHDGKPETIRVEDSRAPQHFLAPFALEIEHFGDCIRENRAPQFPPDTDAERDSLGNARVLDALAESARRRRPVGV